MEKGYILQWPSTHNLSYWRNCLPRISLGKKLGWICGMASDMTFGILFNIMWNAINAEWFRNKFDQDAHALLLETLRRFAIYFFDISHRHSTNSYAIPRAICKLMIIRSPTVSRILAWTSFKMLWYVWWFPFTHSNHASDLGGWPNRYSVVKSEAKA